ncbi:hypothetical protein [Halostella sp. PRR32]|uniref:hypothetical protein n=1 Tax=Halostella sp. PRR32 TaxID=3098147 RepID=UPI002B1DD920|nr:hypothetical protein [Halostella sp. PRR32]
MTFNSSIDQCTSTLITDFGDALRLIGVGDGAADEFEIQYIRDDIAEQYSPPDRRELFDGAILEALMCERQEDLVQRGELEYTIRVFERGINLLCRIGDRRMLFVGVDRDLSLIPATIARIERETSAGGDR